MLGNAVIEQVSFLMWAPVVLILLFKIYWSRNSMYRSKFIDLNNILHILWSQIKCIYIADYNIYHNFSEL